MATYQRGSADAEHNTVRLCANGHVQLNHHPLREFESVKVLYSVIRQNGLFSKTSGAE
jgi:hypothetical protein